MKVTSTTTMLLALLSKIGIAVSTVWVIVSFLKHLVKDLTFNWDSVTCFVTCLILYAVFMFLSAIKHGIEEDQKKKDNWDKVLNNPHSTFSQKMRDIESKRKQNQN